MRMSVYLDKKRHHVYVYTRRDISKRDKWCSIPAHVLRSRCTKLQHAREPGPDARRGHLARVARIARVARVARRPPPLALRVAVRLILAPPVPVQRTVAAPPVKRPLARGVGAPVGVLRPALAAQAAVLARPQVLHRGARLCTVAGRDLAQRDHLFQRALGLVAKTVLAR